MSEITRTIEKKLGNIGNKIQLNLISWNGAVPKYDLRNWYTDKNGNDKYSKGVTLTTNELRELKALLNTMTEI